MDKKTVDNHTIEYYSAIKIQELLNHAVVWMNLKGIIRGEIRHIQKVIYYMILFICHSGKTLGIESGL